MTHIATHCGVAGQPTGEKTIKIYTGSVLNYAVHLDREGMAAYGIPEWAIDEFEHYLWDIRAQLVEKLLHMGIPYTYHVPHAENLDHD
jgi:hypothetical protein